MFRKILISFIALLLTYLQGFSQTETTITVPTSASGFSTYQALLYLPPSYSTDPGTTKYALIYWGHGAGEYNPPLSNIYNNQGSGGIPYQIEHGNWPSNGAFTCPLDGVTYKFIVVSPQAAGSNWSAYGPQIDYIIRYMVANYRVDTNRIYTTGLSAGGAGIVSYSSHIDNNTGAAFTPRYKVAAMVPMSEANGSPSQAIANTIVADSTRAWGFGDQNNDVHGDNTRLLIVDIKSVKPTNWARFSGNPGDNGIAEFTTGHGPWNKFYIPTYTENFTYKGVSANWSIYTWMLANTLSTTPPPTPPPTVSAGANQTVVLPNTTATLFGNVAPATGHSATVVWTQTSGPNTATIASPTAAQTNLSGLIQGTYIFKLTATQDDSQTGNSSVSVFVNTSAPPIASAGNNQSITLPVSSVSLSAAASVAASGRFLNGYNWIQVSGPNTAFIANSTSASTLVNALIQGTYVFRVTVTQDDGQNANASVTIVVNAATGTGCGSHNKYFVKNFRGYQNGVVISPANSDFGPGIDPSQFHGGDTLSVTAGDSLGVFWIDGIHGDSHSCPITIINEGGEGFMTTFQLKNSTHVHVTGTGFGSLFYGLKSQFDPYCNNLGGVGVSFEGRSKDIEFDHIFMHNQNQGVFGHTENTCIDSLIYPNWVMDSLIVHDCAIIGTAHEGMYIGSTSPDNGPSSYDPRPVNCNGTIVYPRPMRIGFVHIYNCIVDSTGRGGIQVASAQPGTIQEIDHNTVRHNGMSGVINQGTGISIGSYCAAYIHDNSVVNVLTWNIASLGGSGTNRVVRIENNFLDSTAMLYTYDNVDDESVDCPNGPFFPPGQIPGFEDPLTFTAPIFLKTVPILNTDSTTFSIKNNTLGLSTKGGAAKIKLQNGYFTMTLGTTNYICNNIDKATGLIVPVDADIAPATYSTDCNVIPPVPISYIIIKRARIHKYK